MMHWNHKRTEAARPHIYPAQNLAEMSRRLRLDKTEAPRAAAWPTGVSLLAQMVEVCQRCDAEAVCGDWLVRAPDAIVSPPAFCPNADALKTAKP